MCTPDGTRCESLRLIAFLIGHNLRTRILAFSTTGGSSHSYRAVSGANILRRKEYVQRLQYTRALSNKKQHEAGQRPYAFKSRELISLSNTAYAWKWPYRLGACLRGLGRFHLCSWKDRQ